MSLFKPLPPKKVFESKKVVTYYTSLKHLQKPEATILNKLKDTLKNMRMLDIGVGCGRTTYYFSTLVKEYISIDLSGNMIKTCKENYPERENRAFRICDVRSMEMFEDNYFDFVLFSFNGIDNLSHDDRLLSFCEIKRVCKKGGFFCFSTHNLQSIDKLLNIDFSKNPVLMTKRIIKYFLLRILNGNFEKLKNKNFAMIENGLYQYGFPFKYKRYYIKPKEQILQLNYTGFKNIEIYRLDDGKKVEDQSQLNTIKDSWLYYLCKA
jgi:ubiquinone/menaquinone biosynthesis C-methylase UbiE